MHDDGGAKAAKNTLFGLGDSGTLERRSSVILIGAVARPNE